MSPFRKDDEELNYIDRLMDEQDDDNDDLDNIEDMIASEEGNEFKTNETDEFETEVEDEYSDIEGMLDAEYSPDIEDEDEFAVDDELESKAFEEPPEGEIGAEEELKTIVVDRFDTSIRGNNISPAIWLVLNQPSNKLFLVAQDGLKFKNPEAAHELDLKQIDYLNRNPEYILEEYPDSTAQREKAKKEVSEYFDVRVGDEYLSGYKVVESGDKFWILRSAKNGKYSILALGKHPAGISQDKKVENLSYDRAKAIYKASENKYKKVADRRSSPMNIKITSEGDQDSHSLDRWLSTQSEELKELIEASKELPDRGTTEVKGRRYNSQAQIIQRIITILNRGKELGDILATQTGYEIANRKTTPAVVESIIDNVNELIKENLSARQRRTIIG